MWCRAKWVLPTSGAGAAGGSMSEGYMKLANVAGVDNVRDTSTCEYYTSARDMVLMLCRVQFATDQRKDEDITDIRSTGD